MTSEFVEISRGISAADNDGRFDLEPDHSAEQPRIRRLNAPVEVHETYWAFASTGPFADVAEDLLGPDVKFHHSKLNFKWAGGGEEVKWHQDIQFWPHTNYDVLTLGVYLENVDEQMAPMGVLPGSHEGPLYDLYGEDGRWTGNLKNEDVAALDLSRVAYLAGPAGTITVQTNDPRPLIRNYRRSFDYSNLQPKLNALASWFGSLNRS